MTALPSQSNEKNLQAIDELLAVHADTSGGLLPALHAIQETIGFIPADSVSRIAKALNLSRAEVHGVITYYHHFRSSPPGKHIVRICRAEACQSMGAEQLFLHAEAHLGCKTHDTTIDGNFTLEPAYCLGLCASSPALSINDEVHARVTAELFNHLIATARGQT